MNKFVDCQFYGKGKGIYIKLGAHVTIENCILQKRHLEWWHLWARLRVWLFERRIRKYLAQRSKGGR